MQKAEAGMLPMVGQWMGLALQAGKEAEERGMGIGVGAVIVEKGKLVVVAADSRWVGDNFHAPDGNERGKGRGNPMAHAVMRVIGLVARKRRDLLIRQSPSTIGQEAGQKASADIGGMEDHFLDKPLSELEKEAYEGDAVKGGGYLCVDMDIYITHEPCVMCCMAMLHSRFGRVVFVQRMTRTGGLCVEAEAGDNAGGVQGGGDGVGGGLGYGLFWRQELNWRFLAWQWEDEGDDDYQLVREDVHV
ncbi:MAG: hypothetical protein LQ338_004138 [Usnochroma carphineum]|nr:MAG: hypothetical protein LQ338_004138 [Usnochroma carphineum]